MRSLLIIPVLLAGCATSPEELMARSDWDVCRLSMMPVQGQAASMEARRRGLDCRPYYGPIQAQQASQDAAIQSLIRPPQRPTTSCRSVRIGDSIQTQCY